MNNIDPAGHGSPVLIRPITTGRGMVQTGTGKPVTTGQSFEELLNRQINRQRPLTFSKHAQSRTEQRGIELTQAELQKLDAAVAKAGEKGLNDTLVYMNNTAFIVNVPQKVVVTVVEKAEADSQVFTNIDGAIIL